MANVDLFERTGSAVSVSGINESWVVGKAESVSKQLANYQNRVVTNYRRYGLNLNQFIFLLMLVLIPEISTWPKRLIFVAITYALLVALYGVHSKLIPNTVILAGGKPPGFLARSWPSIDAPALLFPAPPVEADPGWQSEWVCSSRRAWP
jgi:hypothetical protein